MKEILQDQFHDFLEASQAVSPISIRMNHKKLVDFPFDHELLEKKVPWAKNGYYLRKRPSFIEDPMWHAGAYYVQEPSSMVIGCICQMLSFTNSIICLDFCAAPGGKTSDLANSLPCGSVIVANEVIPSRRAILEENLEKWGAKDILVTGSDASKWENVPPIFDLILIDAPCSGEGMFRKDPKSINEWSSTNQNICVQRQSKILDIIPDKCKEDGYLIYSTCTFNPHENIERIEGLLSTGDWSSQELDFPTEWGITNIKGNHGAVGYQFYWHKSEGEGFFVSVLKRIGKQNFKESKQKNVTNTFSPASHLNEIEKYFINSHNYSFWEDKLKNIYYMSPQAIEVYDILNKLMIVKSLCKIASLIGNKIIPEHASALVYGLVKENHNISVGLEDAVSYLRRQNFTIPSTHDKGWKTIAYKGLNIGWVKLLDNRINNYYPKRYQILKK